MKVVIFGCQQIAVDIIKKMIINSKVDLPLIITYELPLDQTYGYESVLDFSKKSKLNVINPLQVTSSLVDQIKGINPDIILSLYYRKILPKSIIELPRLGCINIHPSLLPEYRGPVPTAWAIEKGEKNFGITIHKMDNGIDTGDILIQKKYRIFHNETGFELYTRAMKLGAKLFNDNFLKIIDGKIKPKPQNGIGSYYGKKNGRYTIDWKKSVEEIKNMIRVHAPPYNPADTILFNRYVLVNRSREYFIKGYVAQTPGKIIKVLEDERLVVSCSDGLLLLEDYKIIPSLNKKDKVIYLKEGNSFG